MERQINIHFMQYILTADINLIQQTHLSALLVYTYISQNGSHLQSKLNTFLDTFLQSCLLFRQRSLLPYFPALYFLRSHAISFLSLCRCFFFLFIYNQLELVVFVLKFSPFFQVEPILSWNYLFFQSCYNASFLTRFLKMAYVPMIQVRVTTNPLHTGI